MSLFTRPPSQPALPKLSELIRTIEAELSDEYVPRAIQWADDTMNGAWSAAIDRFDNVLSRAIYTGQYALIDHESFIYRDTIIGLIRKFKEHNKIRDADAFLSSIRSKSKT